MRAMWRWEGTLLEHSVGGGTGTVPLSSKILDFYIEKAYFCRLFRAKNFPCNQKMSKYPYTWHACVRVSFRRDLKTTLFKASFTD